MDRSCQRQNSTLRGRVMFYSSLVCKIASRAIEHIHSYSSLLTQSHGRQIKPSKIGRPMFNALQNECFPSPELLLNLFTLHCNHGRGG